MRLNETELVRLCKDAGHLSAHRGLGRETLERILAGTIDATEHPSDPIDPDRAVMCYLQEKYPDIIFGQLKCSAEDYACELCPPGRVVGCAVFGCEQGLRQQVIAELELERRRGIG